MSSLAVLNLEAIDPTTVRPAASTLRTGAAYFQIRKGMAPVPRLASGMDALFQRVVISLFSVPSYNVTSVDRTDDVSLEALLSSSADSDVAMQVRLDILDLVRRREHRLIEDQAGKFVPSDEILRQMSVLFVDFNTTTNAWQVGIQITNAKKETAILVI